MYNIFIDGSVGTTGLRIASRLASRDDINLLSIPEELRKDNAAVAERINASDVTFLCLPDAAAKEAVTLCKNPNTVIIDASTAHRTADGWAYGFPELLGRREDIKASKRIANPGCHASGFIALVYPLVKAGIVPADLCLSAFSLPGYSGGGKKMIAGEQKAEQAQGKRCRAAGDGGPNDGAFGPENAGENALQRVSSDIVIAVAGGGGKMTGGHVFFMECIQYIPGAGHFIFFQTLENRGTILLRPGNEGFDIHLNPPIGNR